MKDLRVRDYNGTGIWSVASVRERYATYAASAGIALRQLQPREHVGKFERWIYPIMDAVISGIRAGDVACARIGVEFLEEDRKFAFGANLKARTARALRRVELPEALQSRLRDRFVSMLIAGNIPREYREHVKLLRKLGFEDHWSQLDAQVRRDNRYVMRYFGYLRDVHAGSAAVVRGGGS